MVPMAHTKTTRARAYEKMKNRRMEWLLSNGPCRACGSSTRLEIDHVNPSQKVHHAVWSWSLQRMLAELEKCQVLCNKCHKKKSARESRELQVGVPRLAYRILKNEQVTMIRDGKANGLSERSLAKSFGVSKTTIHCLLVGESYREI